MPICEGCGEEFPKGGAFVTHIEYCDEVDESQDEGEKDLEDRVDDLEANLDLVRDMLMDDLDRQARETNEVRDLAEETLELTKLLAEGLKHVEENQEQFQKAMVEMKRKELIAEANDQFQGEAESVEEVRGMVKEAAHRREEEPDADELVEQVVDQVRVEGQSGG